MADFDSTHQIYMWDNVLSSQYYPTWDEFISQIKLDTPFSQNFDNTDLVSGVLTVNHGLGRRPAGISVYDGAGNLVTAPTQATTTQIIVNFNGAISGSNWEIVAN